MAHHRHIPGTQHPRRRRHIDWELITCGISGHVLVGREAGPARPEDALLVQDHGDVRWHRCLRCDTWIPLPLPATPTRPILRTGPTSSCRCGAGPCATGSSCG